MSPTKLPQTITSTRLWNSLSTSRVAKNSENQRFKAKRLFKKNYISFVENVNEKVRFSCLTNFKFEKKGISYSELRRVQAGSQPRARSTARSFNRALVQPLLMSFFLQSIYHSYYDNLVHMNKIKIQRSTRLNF